MKKSLESPNFKVYIYCTAGIYSHIISNSSAYIRQLIDDANLHWKRLQFATFYTFLPFQTMFLWFRFFKKKIVKNRLKSKLKCLQSVFQFFFQIWVRNLNWAPQSNSGKKILRPVRYGPAVAWRNGNHVTRISHCFRPNNGSRSRREELAGFRGNSSDIPLLSISRRVLNPIIWKWKW